MRKVLILAALLVAAVSSSAEDFIRYHAPGGSGAVSPTQFSDPVGGFLWGGSAGAVTGSVDFSVVPSYSSGTGDVAATGALGTFYFETDIPALFTYPATDTEHWVLSIAPASIAQGDIFYASAARTLARLGAGVSGQFLKTQGAAANPVWADASTTFDSSTTIHLYEDCLGGGTTTGNIGTNGLLVTLIASGVYSLVGADATHIGLCRFTTHGTNDASGVFVGTSANWAALAAATAWSTEAEVVMGSNGTVITDTLVAFGVQSGGSQNFRSASAGAWIRFDPTVDGDATFKFQVCDAAGAAGCQSADDDTNSTLVTSTITPVGGNTYRLRIRYALAGVGGNPTLYMRVNAETEVTFCTSGCSADINDLVVANTANNIGLDYMCGTADAAISGDMDTFVFDATVARQ